jgi:hypothetical protein
VLYDVGIAKRRLLLPTGDLSYVAPVTTAAFDPSSVTPDLWLDPSDLTKQFQLSGGTTAVTADGDPVGYIGDKGASASNFTQATSGKRPLYKTDGTLSWLLFDGVDDFLESVNNQTAFLTDTTFDLICAGVIISNNSQPTDYAASQFYSDKGNGTGGLSASSNVSNNLTAYGWTTGLADHRINDAYTANTAFVARVRHESSVLYLKQNARTEVSVSHGQNYTLANHLYLATTYNAGTFTNMKFHGLVARKTVFSSTEASNLTTWMGNKIGLSL